MAPRALVRAFLALYVTLGIVVLIQSLQTVLAARHGPIDAPNRIHALLLGSLEAIAAFLFLMPRTMGIGANALLTIFGLAFGIHALQGQPNLALLVYAAAVLFVRIHGVRDYRWTAAKATV